MMRSLPGGQIRDEAIASILAITSPLARSGTRRPRRDGQKRLVPVPVLRQLADTAGQLPATPYCRASLATSRQNCPKRLASHLFAVPAGFEYNVPDWFWL